MTWPPCDSSGESSRCLIMRSRRRRGRGVGGLEGSDHPIITAVVVSALLLSDHVNSCSNGTKEGTSWWWFVAKRSSPEPGTRRWAPHAVLMARAGLCSCSRWSPGSLIHLCHSIHIYLWIFTRGMICFWYLSSQFEACVWDSPHQALPNPIPCLWMQK